jgi:hypothetical protein
MNVFVIPHLVKKDVAKASKEFPSTNTSKEDAFDACTLLLIVYLMTN